MSSDLIKKTAQAFCNAGMLVTVNLNEATMCYEIYSYSISTGKETPLAKISHVYLENPDLWAWVVQATIEEIIYKYKSGRESFQGFDRRREEARQESEMKSLRKVEDFREQYKTLFGRYPDNDYYRETGEPFPKKFDWRNRV